MNILIVSGSRNPEGQTARAVSALVQGIGAAGGTCRQCFLPSMQIERCRQCENNGWGLCRSEGRCIIEDDFSALVAQIRAADAVVFATPVYYGDLSESLRAFLDRLRRTCTHDAGKAGITGKPAVGICVAGGGGGGGPSCTVSLEKVLRTCGFDVLDLVPVRRQNLPLKEEVLRITGKWLGETLRREAG
ncbi:MAG: flavodoxin family protein [Armatimonadota bacterium]|nr:flavodoxin family protein [Armatimonadota bacterium]